MKKMIVLAIAAIFGMQCSNAVAQRPRLDKAKTELRPEITELVSDLNASQKRKLKSITAESRERVDKLRREQKIVRDSIEHYMEMDGDQSTALYPFFDREARLQAEVSREMYETKVRIDEVLTPEQRKELKEANKRHHHKSRKK